MSQNKYRSYWRNLLSHSAMLLVLCFQGGTQAIPHLYYDDLGFTLWRSSWPAALQESQLTGKPIYVQYTHLKCPLSPLFCKQFLSDPQVQKMLRRYFVCLAVDYHQCHRELDHILRTKGYTDAQTPLHVLLTPQKEVLAWYVKCLASDDFARDLLKAAGDKRFAMSKVKEKEIEKINKSLEASIQSKDSKKIKQQWQQFLSVPGYSESKNKGFAMMEEAEEPARKKLYEAARLVRDQKQPLAQVALEEANRLAESLPIASEISQTLSALKLLEQANEAERLAKTVKQKQQALGLYQQIMNKYPDNTIASVVYQKLRSLSQSK